MAKEDYSIDVGMWAVQPGQNTGGDAALDTLLPHFERIWDGHPQMTKRACNVLMTYGNTQAWGYIPDEPDRAKRQAYAFGKWMLHVKEANASTGGAGAPRYLGGIVFRGLWNLTKVPSEPHWTPDEIQKMANYFLDYFRGVGSPLPVNNGQRLSRNDLSLLRGYLLGDDCANPGWPHSNLWDSIVEKVHDAQKMHSLNFPFYFSNQIFSSTLWTHGASFGRRLNNLRAWLNVFNDTGATPVFLPQFYPWDGGMWNYHDERDAYVWWYAALDELLYLKNHGYPSLRIQPIIQACTNRGKAGPGHPDIHNQLRAVLDHGVVEGVWLLNWNYADGYAWTCYRNDDNRWTDKQHIAEAIQVEVGGDPETVIASVPCSGMIDAYPTGFRSQTGRNRGSGGTRLSFNLDTRQPIRIRITGPTSRTQLDGYTWTGRRFSYNGPWSKGQYTRDPRLRDNDPRLNPLHGTSINWNGWREEDISKAPSGSYSVQLQDATGNRLGNNITVNVQ